MTEKSVLPPKFSEGPHGLGDPNDRTLRKVEVEVLIPKLMREKAKSEKCIKEVADFTECCKNSSVFMVVTCRDQNSALKSCLSNWYQNEDFKKICTQEYLDQRSEYRETGKKKPMKRA
ncbi:COX assembly mitochondrial protein homolog [Epargyreus clarus]|uniref:COX assembly mitochondrial protein homolog n=1 Tax=Epargyreus clarus TaxID=520877 RepID=UPI003C2F9EA0